MTTPPEMSLAAEEVQVSHHAVMPVRPQTPELCMFEPGWWRQEDAAPATPVRRGARFHGDDAGKDADDETRAGDKDAEDQSADGAGKAEDETKEDEEEEDAAVACLRWMCREDTMSHTFHLGHGADIV